ncbi:outer membrane transport energization protein ExbD [Halopseudomonas xinjiangensis]|uniref:Outer membrane transport energization protein ExbD n=1 Tax=Halopseudomonas xinjiangensis TaxID=487184 RepID=A0A1H1Q174_9GAMM|nr:biopolymer transporter ExbD [Halopseudomonas xinjiangensis]SDS17160.1 outer membrane transport energization protein ExbD [Halopseudomonas xinjiangensis]
MQDHPLMARRGTANPDDNLIPLINIVFLLLIFFMVAGQIAPQQDMTIDPPESASEKALEPAELELSLTATGDLRSGGEPVDAAALEARIAELTQAGAELRVSLRADTDATAADLDAVFNQLREHGVSTITLHSRLTEAD